MIYQKTSEIVDNCHIEHPSNLLPAVLQPLAPYLNEMDDNQILTTIRTNIIREVMKKNNTQLVKLKQTAMAPPKSPSYEKKCTVKRVLFVEPEEIDHEANLNLVKKQLKALEEADCRRWNFDFANNRPINSADSRYEWYMDDNNNKNDDNDVMTSEIENQETETIVIQDDDVVIPQPKVTTSTTTAKSTPGRKKVSAKRRRSSPRKSVKESNKSSSSDLTIVQQSKKRKMNINDYFVTTKKQKFDTANAKVKSNDEHQDDDVIVISTAANTTLINV